MTGHSLEPELTDTNENQAVVLRRALEVGYHPHPTFDFRACTQELGGAKVCIRYYAWTEDRFLQTEREETDAS
jgi:hypothetical protein